MFNEYSGTPGHSNALLGIPKGRLGPLVVWRVRGPYERSSGALWYFLARKKVHYTYSKPCFNAEKSLTTKVVRLVFALPIFPGSRPPSIVGADELNFCVRDGNRWTLIAINTNYIGKSIFALTFFLVTRTGFEPMLTA